MTETGEARGDKKMKFEVKDMKYLASLVSCIGRWTFEGGFQSFHRFEPVTEKVLGI